MTNGSFIDSRTCSRHHLGIAVRLDLRQDDREFVAAETESRVGVTGSHRLRRSARLVSGPRRRANGRDLSLTPLKLSRSMKSSAKDYGLALRMREAMCELILEIAAGSEVRVSAS
jgi:hypothetical protein